MSRTIGGPGGPAAIQTLGEFAGREGVLERRRPWKKGEDDAGCFYIRLVGSSGGWRAVDVAKDGKREPSKEWDAAAPRERRQVGRG
jgi:hypothetical protein